MNNLSPEQKIQIERQRLSISDVILHTQQQTLHKLCDSFHFDNADLLEIEFAEYQRTKKSYDRVYATIGNLTAEEINALVPHIHVGQNIMKECLKLADKKDQQIKQQHRQERLKAIKRILNPLAYLALFASKKTSISDKTVSKFSNRNLESR